MMASRVNCDARTDSLDTACARATAPTVKASRTGCSAMDTRPESVQCFHGRSAASPAPTVTIRAESTQSQNSPGASSFGLLDNARS